MLGPNEQLYLERVWDNIVGRESSHPQAVSFIVTSIISSVANKYMHLS